jgi:hypothetical protein
MPRHDRQPTRAKIALDQLEVGPTDGARGELEHELIRSRLRIDKLDESEWRRGDLSWRAQLKGEHVGTLPQMGDRPIG